MKLHTALKMYKLLQRFLIIFLLVGSSALIRKAQHDFFKIDGNHPLRGIFSFDGANSMPSNLKESFDDGNIQKVINILQNNIKQWSFIESQLLEPNVNLGMPEIFIPLKHLTTTLEILGNIFFVQNDLNDAKNCLERACPLMELLPNSLLMNTNNDNIKNDDIPIDFVDINDDISINSDKTLRKSILEGPSGTTKNGLEQHKTYAESCFSLLRDVYTKLYGGTLRVRVLKDSSSSNKNKKDTKRILRHNKVAMRNNNNLGVKQTIIPTRSVNTRTNAKTSDDDVSASIKHQRSKASHHSTTSTESTSINHQKSTDLKDTTRRNTRLASIFTESEDDEEDWEEGQAGDTLGEEEINHSDQSDIKSNHAEDQIILPNDIENEEENTLSQYNAFMDFEEIDDEFLDEDFDTPSAATLEYFDIDQKFEDLRSPFEHLRSELSEIISEDMSSFEYSGLGDESVAAHNMQIDSNFDDNIFTESGVGLGLSASRRAISNNKDHFNVNKHVSNAVKEPSARMCTSTISEDLENMLRRFVKEDHKGRKKVLQIARKYYDELDITFPSMDYNEYAANMDMGQVYLDVMNRVCEEGFDFITEELESWQTDKLSSIVSNLDEKKNIGDEYDKQHQSIVWELDPVTGEQREIVVEFSGNYFNAFNLAERNRLLVLSAFDIVRTAPDDPFNLGLGFNLGILDNDRSHNGEILMDKVLRDAVSSASASGHLFDHNINNEIPNKLSISFDSLYGSDRKEGFHSDQHFRKLYSNGFYFSNRDGFKNDLSSADLMQNRNNKNRIGAHNSNSNNANKKKRKINRNIVHDENLVHEEAQESSISDGRVNNQASSDAIYDDTVTATVGLSAPIRSAVPTLGSDSGWVILTLLALFILLIGLSIFVAKQADSNKKRSTPFRHKNRGSISRKGSLLGANIVDFMYAYLYGSNLNSSDGDAVTESSNNNEDNNSKSTISSFYSVLYSLCNTILEFLSTIANKTASTSASQNKSKRSAEKITSKSFITSILNEMYELLYFPFTATSNSLKINNNQPVVAAVGNVLQGSVNNTNAAEGFHANYAIDKIEHDLSSKSITANASTTAVGKNEPTSHKSKNLNANLSKKNVQNDITASTTTSPPLVVNSRRVSWVVSNEFSDNANESFESEEWAEAKKKNTKKHDKVLSVAPAPVVIQSNNSISANSILRSQTTPQKSVQQSHRVVGENPDFYLNASEQLPSTSIYQSSPQSLANQQQFNAQNLTSVNLNQTKREVSYKTAVQTNVVSKESEGNNFKNESGFNSSLTVGKNSMPLYDLSEAKLIAANMASKNDNSVGILGVGSGSLMQHQESSMHTSPPGLFNIPPFSSTPNNTNPLTTSNLNQLQQQHSSHFTNSQIPYESNEKCTASSFNYADPTSSLWGKSPPVNSNNVLGSNNSNLAMNNYGNPSSSSYGLYGGNRNNSMEHYDMMFDNHNTGLIDLDFLGQDFTASPTEAKKFSKFTADQNANNVRINNVSSSYTGFSGDTIVVLNNSLSSELSVPNITLEASALLSGLSPNAPSFEPFSSVVPNPVSNEPINNLRQINSNIVSLNNHSQVVAANQQFLYPPQTQESNSLYNSDEFYESLLLDSIVDGD